MASELSAPSVLPKQPLSALIAREQLRKRRRLWVAAAVLLALTAAAPLVYRQLRPGPVPMAARFRSEPVTRGDIVREVSATGHLEAVTTVQVGAEISGRIATVEAVRW
jgi:multidrug efflux pump subunit AcrA (membrane-fusion protein)